MAFTAIPNSIIDADSPLDATLFTYLRDNDDYLKTLFNISTGHDHGGGTDDGATVIVNGSNIVTLFDTTSGHKHDGVANAGAPVSVPDGSITAAKQAYSLGDVSIIGSDAESWGDNVDFTKRKAIKIAKYGTLRIKYDLRTTNTSSVAYGRIYRNGAAVGGIQSTASTSYVTMTEDISGWTINDECQLYTYNGNAGLANYYRNFRLYGIKEIVVYEA